MRSPPQWKADRVAPAGVEHDEQLNRRVERAPRTLLVCFLLGLVPVVGVVPAIVFYRIHLVSPLRRYVPFGSALMAKWLGRVACFAVLSIQWIPFLGIGSLPIMAAINYGLYRRAFQSAWRSQQAQTAGTPRAHALRASG